MPRETTGAFGLNGNVPWWVKPLYVYGVPSAIALFLVFQTAVTFPAALKVHAAAAAEGLRLHAVATETGHIATVRLLTVMCVNAADSDVERRYCLSPDLLDVRLVR